MKYIRAIIGLYYYWRYHRIINLKKILKDKRVAIVGAADSALNTGLGNYIDDFDLVIRVNKAPIVIKNGIHENDIGNKLDILFHSFYENEKSGGGALDTQEFNKLGIKYVINPIHTIRGKRVIYNFYKKYLSAYQTYSIEKWMYSDIIKDLNNNIPTIGFCALMSVLNCEFKELYITGFTFFKTPFAAGYRDEIKEVNQVRRLIKTEGHHDVDLEFHQFRKKYNSLNSTKIILDPTLENIVNHEV